MKSNSTQALLVALGAAVITSLLYYLAADSKADNNSVFVLVSLIKLAPAAIAAMVLLKIFVYEKISFLTAVPIRYPRYVKGRDEKQF